MNAVEKLYATALDDTRWKTTLDLLSELFGGVGTSFEIIRTQTSTPELVEFGTGLENVTEQEYLEYYGTISPRVKFGSDKPSGFVSYDHMILSDSEMDRDEFYADCMHPLGLRYFIATQVFATENHHAVFAAQRSPSQGAVGAPEIALMERLVPHLQQVTDLRFRLSAHNSEQRLGLEVLEHLNEGCLTVDCVGIGTHLNGTAEQILAQDDGIRLSRGRLTFIDQEARRLYALAIGQITQTHRAAEVPQTRDFPARRLSGKKPYIISVRALPFEDNVAAFAKPSVAMILLRDPEIFARLDGDLLQRSFDLSARELEIAIALDLGKTVQEIARERGLSVTTIRSQLYSLMAKLDVRRQADLIRLLAQYHRPFT